MTDLFLLGAGASVEAGIPGAFGMTTKMLDLFSQDRRLEKQNKILRFVAGGLLFQRGVVGENPFNGVNIEDMFNAVLMLADRKKSELSSFVSSWNPIIEELERGEVPHYTATNLLKTIFDPLEEYFREQDQRNRNHERYNPLFGNRINTFHSEYTFQQGLTLALGEFLKGSGGKLFADTAERMTRKLIEMTWLSDTSIIQYLTPMTRYAQQTDATIATLNYDNTVELSAQAVGALCDTGFESWSQSGEFSFKGGHIPLIKLHGSIDWALTTTRPTSDKPLKFEMIKQVDPTSQNNRDFRPAIVFGGKNKLTAKGPFLSLLRKFDEHLGKSNRLVIIGYSFGDEHVNEYIRTWINADSTRVIVTINPGIVHIHNPFIDELRHIQNRARVVEIGKKASDGILEIVSSPGSI